MEKIINNSTKKIATIMDGKWEKKTFMIVPFSETADQYSWLM